MEGSFGQFCPVAMGAGNFLRALDTAVLRELLSGSTKFNDIQARRTAHVADAAGPSG